MIQALTKECKIAAFSNVAAADQDGDVVAGTAIDTEGFDGICAALKLGTVTANGVVAFKLQHSDVSNDDFVDIDGAENNIATAVAGDANKILVIEVKDLTKRYVRTVYQRTAQDISIDAGVALLYNARKTPATSTDVKAAVFVDGAADE